MVISHAVGEGLCIYSLLLGKEDVDAFFIWYHNINVLDDMGETESHTKIKDHTREHTSNLKKDMIFSA